MKRDETNQNNTPANDLLETITDLLGREKFDIILELLGEGDRLVLVSLDEKARIVKLFDNFLEEAADKNRVFSLPTLRILAEIKRYIILYQLEQDGFERSRLKKLVRHKLHNSRPLADLLHHPLAFSVDQSPLHSTQAPIELTMEIYREVLAEMDAEDAANAHRMQILFYHGIAPAAAYKRFALQGIQDVVLN